MDNTCKRPSAEAFVFKSLLSHCRWEYTLYIPGGKQLSQKALKERQSTDRKAIVHKSRWNRKSFSKCWKNKSPSHKLQEKMWFPYASEWQSNFPHSHICLLFALFHCLNPVMRVNTRGGKGLYRHLVRAKRKGGKICTLDICIWIWLQPSWRLHAFEHFLFLSAFFTAPFYLFSPSASQIFCQTAHLILLVALKTPLLSSKLIPEHNKNLKIAQATSFPSFGLTSSTV